MTAARPRWFRRAPLAAALLALCVQLMFPAGFMAASAGEARGFPIVICTAQGSRHLTGTAGVDNLNDRSYFLFHPFPRRTAILSLTSRL